MKPFHAHHPTIGGASSLLAGLDGAACELQLVPGEKLSLGMFVGVRQEPSLPWRMLPLFSAAPEAGEAFETLTPGRYGRTFALASDRWLIGPLVFKLCTPWWVTASPDKCDRDTARLHFAPSVGGFVEYDNTHSEEPVEVIVGFGAAGAGFTRATGSLVGFTSDGRIGFATAPSADVRMRLARSPFAEGAAGEGAYAALVFTIPAKAKRVFPFAFAILATDETSIHHSLFTGIDHALAASVANNAEIIRRSDELDGSWFAAPGTREEKLARANTVRSHLAGSCVKRVNDRWVVAPAADGLADFDAEFFPWALPE